MTEGRTAPGGPTVQRMLVGTQLRRLRTEAGLSREQAGEAIRASEWKIHRLENGQVGFKERDIIDLLRLYGVTDPDEVAAVVAAARAAFPAWRATSLSKRTDILFKVGLPRSLPFFFASPP